MSVTLLKNGEILDVRRDCEKADIIVEADKIIEVGLSIEKNNVEIQNSMKIGVACNE